MRQKNVYIIAGPNGSGKTTFARMFLPSYVKCPNFVNADLIAQGLAPVSVAESKSGQRQIIDKQVEMNSQILRLRVASIGKGT